MFSSSIPVFIQPTKDFLIPSDSTKDMIMVGPGTGIAPFRAFLEHRRATEASGKNWLFFGEVHENFGLRPPPAHRVRRPQRLKANKNKKQKQTNIYSNKNKKTRNRGSITSHGSRSCRSR